MSATEGVFTFVQRGVYQDSVALMRLTRDMEAVPGVRRAAALMGTPENLALMKNASLLAPGAAAGPTDLVIGVSATSPEAAEAACRAAEAALAAPAPAATVGSSRRLRTLAAGLRALPDATLALISVPGVHAGAEARRALDAGLHVMLFSDNVPIRTEVELKRRARERMLFVMGPDCGSAIVAGVPLGFANAVPRGPIGIAAASGTGLQAVACHIAAAGEGVSHALGVGGRDLMDEVGGLMMEQALDALAADESTAVLCVVGKPPGPTTRTRLCSRLAALGKPCVVHFVGDAGAGTVAPGVHAAATLEDAALAAVALRRGEVPRPVAFTADPADVQRLVEEAVRGMTPGQRFVRGVYAGGTLAHEALGMLRARLTGVAGDVTATGDGHRVVDLGEDVFTVGRPHPMIDGTVRREWILAEGRDPATAVILLDLVLGYGAHDDPAGEIVPAIRAATREATAAGRRLAVVASVCGTDADRQGRASQVGALAEAGVVVMPSNAQAARLAALIAARQAAG